METVNADPVCTGRLYLAGMFYGTVMSLSIRKFRSHINCQFELFICAKKLSMYAREQALVYLAVLNSHI